MRWSTKTASCQTCGTQYEWTTRDAGLCRPCRKDIHKSQARERYRQKKGGHVMKIAEKTYDTMPKVDWAMERQFETFFSLMGKRYKSIKDVASIIDSGHYRQKMKA